MPRQIHHRPDHHNAAGATMGVSPTLPGMFTCDRLRARMTEAGCGRMWRSASDSPPRANESRAACIGCEIGARNAGVDVERAREATRAAELAPACARCNRTGRRMIGGTTCISCYNREREARCGRDARGRVPKFADRYHPVSLVIALPGTIGTRTFARVAGRAEAIILAARQANGAAIAIGFHRLSPLPEGATLDPSPAFDLVPPSPPRCPTT